MIFQPWRTNKGKCTNTGQRSYTFDDDDWQSSSSIVLLRWPVLVHLPMLVRYGRNIDASEMLVALRISE